MSATLLTGWGEADITPTTAVVELAGQYYQRLSRELHSHLKTVALAISQGEETAIFVSIDTVGLHAAYCERLRHTLAARIPGLPSDRVIFNAIHTHSAPSLKPGRNWWTRAPEALTVEAYQDLVEEQVVSAVSQAWSTRAACQVAPVLESARIGHCRRVVYADGSAEMYGRTDREDFAGLEGGEDSGVELLFFLGADQEPRGVILNIACPSQVMEATYAISSDFMGALREKLRREFGASFYTLCQVGAAGCQSPRDLTRIGRGEADFWHADGVEVLSERLLQAVLRGAMQAQANLEPHPILAHTVTPLALPRRRVSYAEFKHASAELARLEAAQDITSAFASFCEQMKRNEAMPHRPGPYDDKTHPFVLMRNHEAVLKRYRDQDEQPNFAMQLHTVRIGTSVMVTNPFELFLEYGQRLKARSKATHTFVVQLADDSGGYLPTTRAEQLGGYGALINNGQVGSDGGTLLVDRTLEQIDQLWERS